MKTAAEKRLEFRALAGYQELEALVLLINEAVTSGLPSDGIKRVYRMASSKEYLDYILEQLSAMEDVTCRAMMGEYIIYYRGKIVGGIYDDRFLVKPTKSAVAMNPNADLEAPYKGAKQMLLVDNVDNREFLKDLLNAMYDELPGQKKKK